MASPILSIIYRHPLLRATEFNMLRPTIQHRTVQPRDSGRLAPPTEPTESRGGRLSIPNHKYHKLYNIPHFLTTDTTTSSMRRVDKHWQHKLYTAVQDNIYNDAQNIFCVFSYTPRSKFGPAFFGPAFSVERGQVGSRPAEGRERSDIRHTHSRRSYLFGKHLEWMNEWMKVRWFKVRSKTD